MNINSKYFLIYDFKEDPQVEFDYINKYLKENNFDYVDSRHFLKRNPQQFTDFLGKSYEAYLIRSPNIS